MLGIKRVLRTSLQRMMGGSAVLLAVKYIFADGQAIRWEKLSISHIQGFGYFNQTWPTAGESILGIIS